MANETDKLTRTVGSFSEQLEQLVQSATADGENIEGAWVSEGADDTTYEILITSVDTTGDSS